MLKALFGKGYSRAFIDRVEFRRAEYYEKRRIQTIRDNAMKMAVNWSHEYPTGTPLAYIRDDIIECWERSSKVGIYSGIDVAEEQLAKKRPIKKYINSWRNPADKATRNEILRATYKIEGEHE